MKVKLGDYVLMVQEREVLKKVDTSKYVSTENILADRNGVKFPANTIPLSKTITTYKKDDILISNIRPYFKKIWKAEFDGPKSNDVIAFRTKDSRLLQDYLYVVLQSDNFFNYVTNTAKGTKMPRGDKKAIINYEFELPNIQLQRKISHTILVLEKKIRLNNQINDNLIAISKAKWLDLLSSTSTTEVVMNKIAKITMGQSPKSSTYNTNNEGLPLLNGATDFRENINPQRWTSDPKRVVYPNSYIFGVRATIGLTTKVYQKYAIGRGTGAATPINIIYDEFLYFYLEDLFKFYSQTGSGSVYINISKKEFENYKIDVPKISFIEQFHSEINPLFNQIKNNKLQNITLLQIKNDMLNKYFQ